MHMYLFLALFSLMDWESLFQQYNLIYNLLQKMLRKIAYVTVIITAVLFLYFGHKFVLNYSSYARNKTRIDDQHGQQVMKQAFVLTSLEELTSIPFLGNYFLQDKLMLLVEQKKWHDVLKESLDTQGAFATKFSLNLLTYRAIAQCATYQFRKCEQTIDEIGCKAPHLYPRISYLDIKNRNVSGGRRGGEVRNVEWWKLQA